MTGPTGGDVQGVLEGMPRRLYPCTPTRLLTWLDCPRRYRFSYLDRPAPPTGPAWAHTSLGTSVHTALAAWWRLRPRERTPQRGAGLVRDCWVREGYRDDAQSEQVLQQAARWVRDYLVDVDPAVEPVGVERTVSSPTGALVLSGRVDRIDERPDGSVVVVDYKTGRRPPADDDARGSLALAVYAVATARTLRRPCAVVELHHLPTGTVAAAAHGEESLARKLAEAESIAREARAADTAYAAGRTGDDTFPARASSMCSWCDFRPACAVGRQAAPPRQPWEALVGVQARIEARSGGPEDGRP
ncbi:MAG TPA: PD-(D/E)XK nuclease family protein [Kineosporiaceae bacterium]|nr:PD-(D/E)XK nuclease family protein [Kineosporiaceae bacterium]